MQENHCDLRVRARSCCVPGSKTAWSRGPWLTLTAQDHGLMTSSLPVASLHVGATCPIDILHAGPMHAMSPPQRTGSN
jgi:hypothetical protein